MPFKSEAQNRWAHTKAGEKALGGAENVKEWEKATDYSNLPEHKEKKKPGPKPKQVKRLRHTTHPR